MNRSPVRVRLSAQKKACKYLTYRLSSYPHTTKNRLSPKTCSHSEQSCTPATALFSTEDFHILHPRPTCYHEQTNGRFMLSPSAFFLSLGSIHTRTFATSVHLPCPASISQKNKQEIQISVRHITTDGTQATDTFPTLSVTSKLAVIHLRAVSQQSARHHIYVKKLGLARNVFLLIPMCGQRWIRTTEGERQQIYSLPHLATLEFALLVSKTVQR